MSSNAVGVKRWWMGAAVLVLLLAVLALALTRLAAARLHDAVAAALGPRATLQSTALSWHGVELRGLAIAAARGWPAKDELRAERVRIAPDLRSLWSVPFGGAWRVRRIEIDGGYLSLHRTRDGKLRVLPAVLGGAAGDGKSGTKVVVGKVRLNGAGIDLHDSSLSRDGAAHRLRLTALDADIGPLHLPALDAAIDIDIVAVVKGPRHDGKLLLSGQLTPATRNATLAARADGIDLLALQPYLLKAGDGGVKSGRLDLQLDARVRDMRLQAPGKLTLIDLELASSGVLGSLAGAPRQAVLAAMRRDGRIVIAFTLDGRLDDPDFSVNDSLLTRVGSGLAEALGVSVGGVVQGVGGVIKGLFGR